MQEAETHLDELLLRSRRGEDIVIVRDGRPVARLVSVDVVPRVFGQMRLDVPDDFDWALDEAELGAWGSSGS